jgi:hypothetical protein
VPYVPSALYRSLFDASVQDLSMPFRSKLEDRAKDSASTDIVQTLFRDSLLSNLSSQADAI